MALRLRRGTDAERQQPGFIPESGELIYTTDTKLVYVGDGVTGGGLPISSGAFATSLVTDLSPQLGGDLELNSYQITGNGSIDLSGSVSAPAVNTDELAAQSGTTISLANNLDLNSNNIIGIGNINIDGIITATGNISLGDSTDDNVNIEGAITSNLIPQTDSLFNIGSVSAKWQTGYFNELNVDTFSPSTIVVGNTVIDGASDTITTQNLLVDQLYSDDSSVVYDSATSTLASFNVVASRIESASFEGTLTGSVLSSDSSLIIDSELRTVFADEVSTPIIGSPNGELRIRSLVPESQTLALVETTGASTTGGEFLTAGETWKALVFEAASSGSDIASGDVLGVISWAGVQDSTETSVANAMGVQADPAGVTSSTHIPTKYLFANQPAIEGNSPVLMSFDSLGRLAVNQENASATLDVNGYAKLAVLDTAPTSPQNGSVAIADGTGWDPLGTGAQQAVVYLDGAWTSLDTSVTKTVDDIAGTAYTVSATDLGKVLTFRDAGAVTVTLPDAASATIPVGAYVEIANMDATSPIAVAGTASQVVSKEAGAPSIPAFGSVRAIKLSSSEWLVTGDTA